MKSKTYVLSILADNHSGVLLRICGLFARRGYNLLSISAAETQDPNISRLTIVTEADDQTLEQIIKQVQKLHEIHEVLNLSGDISVKREHVLVRAGCSEETRDGLIQVANLYRAKVLNVAQTELMLELTGSPKKIDSFLRLVKPYGIIKMARSGLIALEREL